MKVQNTLFKIAFKQRAYDGKWMKLGAIVDTDNIYQYTTDSGKPGKVIPLKWIILNVYDYEIAFV